MKKLFFLIVLFGRVSFAENWIETGLWSGSNGFLRQDITFLTKFSTGIVVGSDIAYYKLEKKDRVFSFRLPLIYMLSKTLNLSAKPFYYPENGNRMSAYGSRFSVLYHMQNELKEFYSDLSFSFGFEKQKLSDTDFSNSSIEFQIEQNFYDEFFIALTLSSFIEPKAGGLQNKRYSEISDLISTNIFPFINEKVYNNFGIRFARSFKPDYDSYLYTAFDRLNCETSNYNSYLFGLRVYLEKNFFDFSYNYLDAKTGKNEGYYRVNIGVFFDGSSNK